MIFSSVTFLCLFLPVSWFLYRCSPPVFRNAILITTSFFLYCWGEQGYVLVLVFSILFNYGAGRIIHRFRESTSAIWFLWAAVAGNITLLGYYKYAGFLVSNLNWVLQQWNIRGMTAPEIHLPIGVSFFTFKALSYILDVYQKRMVAETNLFHLTVYVSFFPQIAAGPIARYPDMADAIRVRFLEPKTVGQGVERFVIGLGKKVLIADILGKTADSVFSIGFSDLSISLAWLGIFCYTLQIFFDFSGYSDMAIGLGMMFGFRTPENFNYPYCAVSIQDFWRRWHITLSSWFRDYLYIPLGGNRKGSSRTFVHLLLVFLLCGLWHGANWTFVVWGLFHGLFLGLERLGLSRLLDRSPKALRYVYVMSVVSIGWVFFRSATITNAGSYLAAMFGFARGDGIRFPIDAYITPEIVFLIAVGTLLSTPVMDSAKKASGWPHPTAWKEAIRQTGLLVIFLLSLITIVSGSHPSFIYFQF